MLIDPDIILEKLEEFNIYSAHSDIFDEIIDNIETEKKIIISGDSFCGKSFFTKKLTLILKEKLHLKESNIKIIDYPLIILETMLKNGIKEINKDKIKNFLQENVLNEIIPYKDFDIVVFDEINSTIFNDLFRYNFCFKKEQIIFLIISIRGMYLKYKDTFIKNNFKFYDLSFPTEQDMKNTISKYSELNGIQIYKNIDCKKIKKETFFSLFV